MQKQKLSTIEKIQLTLMALLCIMFLVAMAYGQHVQNNVNNLIN